VQKTQKAPFYADFDTDLISKAGESPQAASELELVPGWSGNGVAVKANDVLCYPAPDNVKAEKGSLSLWVKPDWNPGGILYRIFVFGDDPRNLEMHLAEGSDLVFTANTWAANNLPNVFMSVDASKWHTPSPLKMAVQTNNGRYRLLPKPVPMLLTKYRCNPGKFIPTLARGVFN
jgi:hypothetical protein